MEGLAAVLLQEAGVTHIWLPPPSQSVAAQGYLPGQLYNLDSKYGNKEELQALCKELKAAGIMPLADIVINHRCADEKGEDGVYNTFRSADTNMLCCCVLMLLFLLPTSASKPDRGRCAKNIIQQCFLNCLQLFRCDKCILVISYTFVLQ